MVASIPRGLYTMRDRMSIISENVGKYRKSRKKGRSQILDELTEILGMNRKYLSFLMRNAGSEVYTPRGVRIIADPRVSRLSGRGRKKVYTDELIPYLVALWKFSGYLSSVHLVAFIEVNQDKIFDLAKLKGISQDIRDKLLSISHATVDRLLKAEKEKLRLKGRYKPNPHSSSIKRSIPIESYHDKPLDRFGYTEVDLVHHCGQRTVGEFAYTLTCTEITSGWTELRALKNKARVWTLQALSDVNDSLPFKMTGLHVDNGSEFINAHTLRFTQEHGIPLTRSRAYTKNDAPFVESKNWTMVRTYTGYSRYDTPEELAILDQLMRLVSIKHNFFIPTMKIIDKRRDGRKVKKKYSVDTPVYRVITSGKISEDRRKQLIATRQSIDLVALVENIEILQDELANAYQRKYNNASWRTMACL